MNVVVYSKPGCQACRATARHLDKLEIPYTTIDVSQDPAAAQRLRDIDSLTMPRVEVTDYPVSEISSTTGMAWTGYRPSEIERLAELLEIS